MSGVFDWIGRGWLYVWHTNGYVAVVLLLASAVAALIILLYILGGLMALAGAFADGWRGASGKPPKQRKQGTEGLAGLNDLPDPLLLADVAGLIAAGRKIEAIKAYRRHTGIGLRDAMAVIDGAMAQN